MAHQYARDVVAGLVPACLYVRQACQRHLDQLVASKAASFPYRFDERRASFACKALEMLPHVKGKWASGKRGMSPLLKLEPWQAFMTCSIFGWLHRASGLRKYTEIYAEIPRKNAKSTWAAGVGLIMAFLDGEFGAEVYCGATTERQAMEVFGTALKMVRRSPEFQKTFTVEYAVKSIYRMDDGSRMAPVVGNPGDGASPSCAIMDEVHEHQTWVLIDTMRTGMGAREQPLLINITTAGSNIAGPCYKLRLDAIQMLSGKEGMENDSLFAIIYTLDEGDDWKTEESVRKANPNWGISVMPEFLRGEMRRAIQSAHLQDIFKTKHLNLWSGAASGWMNMEAWNRCADPSLQLQDFMGQPCWEGVDLAAKVDLASRIKIYKRLVDGRVHYYAFGRHYVPKAVALDGEHNHYAAWLHKGQLIGHEGMEIQYAEIQAEIEQDLGRYNLQCVAFDPHGAVQMQQALIKIAGDVIRDVPQRWQFLSEPMKEVEAAVLSGRFHHTGDPVFTWAIGNVVVRPDKNGNIFPDKERAENKIDPASALFNAMNQATLGPVPVQSVYESRGALVF